MLAHHRATLTFAAACIACVLAVPAHAALLDAFTTAFPANPCLPSTHAAVIFRGLYCDGTTCPPDLFANCEQSDADQAAGLPGVLSAVGRSASILTGGTEDQASAAVEPTLGQLVISTTLQSNHELLLAYGTPDITQNLDLVALGLAGIAFEVSGAISPAQPLYCQITLLRQEPIPGGFENFSAGAYVAMHGPGPVSVSFSAFVPGPGFSLSAVDAIQISFSDCDPLGDCAITNPPPRSYAIGPITLTPALPTAARRSSWSDLKARYR